MLVGRLATISRYPVKSLRGERLEGTEVRDGGIPGDRTSALIVEPGQNRAGKPYCGSQNDRLHVTEQAADAFALATARGVDVKLHEGRHFFDDSPISIIVDCWLRDLDAHLGYHVEPERFRANFFVHATDGWSDPEETLDGAELELGTVRLRVRYPIERCVVPTYDLHGGAADPRILRFIAQHRSTWLGLYCDVLVPGVATIGDELIVRNASG